MHCLSFPQGSFELLVLLVVVQDGAQQFFFCCFFKYLLIENAFLEMTHKLDMVANILHWSTKIFVVI
jgi:hypothetical protein